MSSAEHQAQVPGNEFVPSVTPYRFGFTGLNPRVENVDGMVISYDVELEMRDGIKLRTDIYRPEKATETLPVLLNYTPYGKHHAFRHFIFYPSNGGLDPSVHSRHANFEGLDPLWWTRRGYIIAYVDCRGSFASDGDKYYYKDIDGLDVYDTIEELAKIDGSNGSVGMAGASALALYQWAGAVHQPPSLKAIIPFDGMTDNLADFYSHGGIPEKHFSALYFSVFAFGNYAGNKTQMPPRPSHAELRSDSDFWKSITSYSRVLSRIKTPLYAICGYQNNGLHTRGTIRGFEEATSEHKYLELHGYRKWEWQLEEESLLRQKAFFDRFTKYRTDTEVSHWPKVRIQMRENYNSGWWRHASDFPMKETVWTTLNLCQSGSLHSSSPQYERSLSFDGTTKQTLCWDWTASRKTIFAGPAKLKVWVDPLTADDLDIHVFLEKIDSEGNFVEFAQHDSLRDGVARGWIRASRRELDQKRSKPYQPILTLGKEQKLQPFEVVPLEIEIITFSVVLRAGEKLRLKIAGRDLYDPRPTEFALNHENINKGLVGVHYGGKFDSHLLLPLVPDVVEHASTAQALEKPVNWYIGAMRLSGFDPLRFISEYTHVHAEMTVRSMAHYPFGFKYQQLFAYPPTEINKVKSAINFESPQITGNSLDAVTRLTFANIKSIKNLLNSPEYQASAKSHQFAETGPGTFGLIGKSHEEVVFKHTSKSLTDVAVYVFHRKSFTSAELKERAESVAKLGVDTQLNAYRQTVSELHNHQEVESLVKDSPFAQLDLLSYKAVEEFIFDGVSSAVGFFVLHSQALRKMNPEAEAQTGFVQYVFDKLNEVEKVQVVESNVRSLA